MRLLPRNLWVVAASALAVFCALVGYYVHSRPLVFAIEVHAHCIKYAGLSMHQYAGAHGGHFPYSAKGYPDALLLLDEDCYNCLTGPGYSPEPLHQAKRDGTPLTEADCGRVYVQGLTTKSDGNIVVLFDKLPTPGGDHCHLPMRLWAPLGREVCYRDGTTNFILEAKWPEFAREQVELLAKAGFDRAEAERLYDLAAQ
jgi:hypothetical protein